MSTEVKFVYAHFAFGKPNTLVFTDKFPKYSQGVFLSGSLNLQELHQH